MQMGKMRMKGNEYPLLNVFVLLVKNLRELSGKIF